MSAKGTARGVRGQYEFIKAHRQKHSVQVMCRLLGVAPSGYDAWLAQLVSDRAQKDARLLRLIRASFTASHGIYGAPRVFLDLREAGERCSKHRVARLMREHQLRALHGYRMRRWSVGKPSVLIPNLLKEDRALSQDVRLEQSAIGGEQRLQIGAFGASHRRPAPQQEPPLSAAVCPHHRTGAEEFLHLIERPARMLQHMKLVEHGLGPGARPP